MRLVCTECGREFSLATRRWRCECGGVFELAERPRFRPEAINAESFSLWRYRAMLPALKEPISLGEGWTPLVPAHAYKREFLAKLEFLAPTGSFKDRGTTVLVSFLRELGVDAVVEDSSGNAAASLAAYCAREDSLSDLRSRSCFFGEARADSRLRRGAHPRRGPARERFTSSAASRPTLILCESCL
jgi:threonine synthase